MERSSGCVPDLFALVTACFCLFAFMVLADQDAQSDEITLERVQIFVKFLGGGPDFSLLVEPDETVENVMLEFYEHGCTPWGWHYLEFGQTRLNYTSKLSDYNISNGSVLTIIIDCTPSSRPSGLYVRTLDGRKLRVTTHLDDKVASLKQEIMNLTGIQPTGQRLLLKGKHLESEQILAHYIGGDDSIVDMGRPLEDCRQTVSVFVKTLSGAQREIEVELVDTVTGLKEKIWEKTGVPVGAQILSAGGRLIAGERHLCDLGLEAGSTVHMLFYSARIKSLDHVARLHDEPPPPAECQVNPHRAPIFREVEAASVPVQNGRFCPASLYKDTRNWITVNPHSEWDPHLFDPSALLDPDPDDDKKWNEANNQYNLALLVLKLRGQPETESERLETLAYLRVRIDLSSAVRPYRKAANLTSLEHSITKRSGINLGDRFEMDGSSKQSVPLGADVNNWAPDAFRDSDVMRLFEISERVRRVLARSAQTGEGLLSVASQKRINRAILDTYLDALSGHPPSVEYERPREEEECGICRDSLVAEPAIKLPCGHTFHSDCILTWADNLDRRQQALGCPYCRGKFIFPFKAWNQAELETQELLDTQDG